jgi:hypothetical protein
MVQHNWAFHQSETEKYFFSGSVRITQHDIFNGC